MRDEQAPRRKSQTRRQGGDLPPSSVTSTEAQNNFGEILGRVSREGGVVITKYRRPEAVVLSMAAYEALLDTEQVDLAGLEGAFDDLVARMQTQEQRAGVDALFAMSSEELGRAAVEQARGDD